MKSSGSHQADVWQLSISRQAVSGILGEEVSTFSIIGRSIKIVFEKITNIYATLAYMYYVVAAKGV